MQKHIFFGAGGLVIGLALGFFAANSLNRTAAGPTEVPQQVIAGQSAVPGQAPGGGGMLPDVAETLEKAEAEPQNFDLQMKVGDMYSKIGRHDKAIEFYLKSVQIKPNDREAVISLANTYFDTKQFENAETYYAKALELDPNDINARTDLGTTLVERWNPDYDRGIKEFHESLKLDPKHEPTLYNMGIAYFRKGDIERARETLTRLEEAHPTGQLVGKLRQIMASK